MAYPKLTLASANIIFNSVGINIIQHELGYYQACVKGVQLQNKKLVDLTHDILSALKN